jgi:hypothetical protein
LSILQAVTRAAAIVLMAGICGSVSTFAQAGELNLDVDLTAYGDNTEFSNPFRVGETLFGAFGTIGVEAALSDHLALRLGVFGHQRFGSRRAFDQVRPALAFVMGSPRSRFVFGTLETPRHAAGFGPDRFGPHGLLPPIQRETLAFDRPWEAGLQWLVDTPRVSQDMWINWQRIARPGEREIFDVGLTNRLVIRPNLALRGEMHVVHRGGQVRADEPVSDSYATALGFEAGGAAGALDRVSVEALALVSRHTPDRDARLPRITGLGTFLRVAVEDGDWRMHAILWRGNDVVKTEGDAHYQSLRRDGTRFGGLRDYLETGVTRRFPLAPRSSLEASARWHRVESHYEYSFRLLAVAHLRRRLGS